MDTQFLYRSKIKKPNKHKNLIDKYQNWRHIPSFRKQKTVWRHISDV